MKILRKISLTILILINFILLVSCGNNNNNIEKLNQFFEKINSEDANYQLVTHAKVSNNEAKLTFEVDKNIMKQLGTSENDHLYIEYLEDMSYMYKYEYNSGLWYKEEYDDSDDSYNLSELNSEDFSYKNNLYVLNDDKLEKHKVKKITIEISEDLENGKFVFHDLDDKVITLTISNFGMYCISLPIITTRLEKFIENMYLEDASFMVYYKYDYLGETISYTEYHDQNRVKTVKGGTTTYYEYVEDGAYACITTNNITYTKQFIGGRPQHIFDIVPADFDSVNNAVFTIKESKKEEYEVDSFTIEVFINCKSAMFWVVGIDELGNTLSLTITYSNYSFVTVTLPTI